MYPRVATNDPAAVQAEVQATYQSMFPTADRAFIPQLFRTVLECFSGHYEDYAPIDARYHDLEHTLQGTLCMSRMLNGRHLSGAKPLLTDRVFQLGMSAILLHDTGYLKKRNDLEGTGAKYTAIHVERSASFAAELLGKRGFSTAEVLAVQNMIRCTGVDADLASIEFQNDAERIVGHALGASDLIGQMAAADYVEKLPILYLEFTEASRYKNGDGHFNLMFSSAEDLMRKTPGFWRHFVLPRLNQEFDGLHRFLNRPLPDGPNEYLDGIEANMVRLTGKFPELKPESKTA